MSRKDKNYPLLFSPLQMGALRLKNRVIALPVHTGSAFPDGRVSQWMLDHYAGLAESGPAMVVVANAAVSSDGKVSTYNLRADKDMFVPGLAKLAEVIKSNGSIACLQLNHAGRFAKTEQPLLPSPLSSENLSFNVDSLKRFMEFFPFEERFKLTKDFFMQLSSWRRAMLPEERERVINDFAEAASRACQAGFDMVELHGANGYLLCQFMSPFTNKIESGFGGDLTGRAQFPLSVIKAVKKKVGELFPVGYRLLLREWVPGGFEFPEALGFAQLLQDHGIAYVSASSGTFNSIFSKSASKRIGKTAYLRKDAKELTSRLDIPVIISGRITMPSIGENMIRSDAADLVGLGRPLRCDPDWIKKARGLIQGKIQTCINCNWCLKQVILEKGINCTLWPAAKREMTLFEHKQLSRTDKTLWVVSNTKDMEIFKQCLPLFFGDNQDKLNISVPDILLLKQETKDPDFEFSKKAFPGWVKAGFNSYKLGNFPVCRTIENYAGTPDDIVCSQIRKGSYSRVFLAAGGSMTWRSRLLYMVRNRVVGILNPNDRMEHIIVPLDLSDNTLLVMAFLEQSFLRSKDFKIRFIHVLIEQPGEAMQRWGKLKSLAGFDPDVPLELIEPDPDVVSTLNKMIHSEKFGTIIMGKRGLSGLKRWLLGSVSSGILDSRTSQSLFLVD